MKKQNLSRLLSLMLAFAMVLTIGLPAGAIELSESGLIVEKVGNDLVSESAKLSALQAKPDTSETEQTYADYEIVRVSIVLSDPSALDLALSYGISTKEIAVSNAMKQYRDSLKDTQKDVADQISNEVLNGGDLDVVWNLTLIGNIISANVRYDQIEEIKAIEGVEDVIIETGFEVMGTAVEGYAPNMATSDKQIGSTIAYLEGYTGAGSRIAIIDTGTDWAHQSFDADAYEYALAELAEKAGMSYDAYVESLDLLDLEEIMAVADQLNAPIGTTYAPYTYVNTKIPYGFNYVDLDFNIRHTQDKQGEHGSHVSGIAAANRYIETAEGVFEQAVALDGVLTQGVAPDAQILSMKVFGANGGAYEADYFAALEDAILLGADAVNLSLGSAGPGFTLNATYEELLNKLDETDTVVVISAGNSYSWQEATSLYNQTTLGPTGVTNYPYYDDVSFHSGGSPGTYTNSLGVASVDNDGITGLFVQVGEKLISYTESGDYTNKPIATIAGEYEYVMITGIGTPEDWAVVGDALEGKVALCYRGETSFSEKANAAIEAGAIAAIICNNDVGALNMNLSDYAYTAPVISITRDDAADVLAASTAVTDDEGNVLYYTGTMMISEKPGAVHFDNEYYTMSDFSSWGVPGDLSIKPEITAPGGNIWSVFASAIDSQTGGRIGGNDQYELMSGTSMAAPQVTGMTALLMQYIRENDLSQDGITDRALAQSLLMSTAVPVIEEASGNLYSILKQGAGLANIGAAVQAKSYILMGADATDSYADGKVKVELGDDPAKTGEYTFSFSVNNMTNEDVEYALSADFFTQDLYSYYLDTWTTPIGATVDWSVDGSTVSNAQGLPNMDFDGDLDVDVDDGQALLDYVVGVRTEIENLVYADLDLDGDEDTYDAYLFFSLYSEALVTVPAGGSIQVTATVTLQDAWLENYENGAYVEGYVYVDALATTEGVQGESHSIPVLGFYGNWTDASMYDKNTFWDYYYDTWMMPSYTYYDLPAIPVGGDMTIPLINTMFVQYAGDADEYIFGGNPILNDGELMPERAALNSENGDKLSSLAFTALRNAGNAMLVVQNAATGEYYVAEELGKISGAYFSVNAGEWNNTNDELSIDWAGEDAYGAALADGTVVDVSLVLVPELYANADGSYNWNAILPQLGEGAYLTNRVTIDNFAPVLEEDGVVIDAENGVLKIAVTDNQYVAAVALYDEFGQYLYTYDGSKADAEAGDTVSYELDLSEVNGASFLLQVYDYAMNTTTYQITQQIGEVTETVEGIVIDPTSLVLQKNNTAVLTAAVLPVNAVNRAYTWSSSDESVATVDENGVVTAVGVGTAAIIATAAADTTITAQCNVTVINLNFDLNGIVWDKEGSVWISEFNTSELPAYTKLHEESAEQPIASMTYGPDGNIYAATVYGDFETPSTVYEVDPVTYDLTKVGGSSEIFYADMTNAPALGCMLAAYAGYVVVVDPETGEDLIAIAEYPNYIVGLAYEGSMYNSYYGAYMDFFLIWDINGNVYEEAFINLGGTIYYFYGAEDGLIGSLPVLATDVPFFQSLYVSGDYAFFSKFVEADDIVTVYALDLLNGVLYTLGQFEEGVWPIGGLMEFEEVSIDNSDVTDMVAKGVVEELTIEKISAPVAVSKASGSLNAVSSVITISGAERPAVEIKDHFRFASVRVTAKDAEGNDIATTNGLQTITYDAELLELVSVRVNGNYTALVRDDENGTVTFGYVSMVDGGIPAGTATAELFFRVLKADDTDVTVVTKEAGALELVYEEDITVKYPHTFTAWRQYYGIHGLEEGVLVRDCTICGHRQFKDGTLPEVEPTLPNPAPTPTPTPTPVPTPDVPAEDEDDDPADIELPFIDVTKEDTCYDDVAYVYEQGLMKGISEELFAPEGFLTRAMVVTTLYRLAGEPEVAYTAQFADVADGEWYTDAVLWAAEVGVVFGYDNGNYGPEDNVTCEQLAAILYRYAELIGCDMSAAATMLAPYEYSAWAETAVVWAHLNGILDAGMSDLTMPATRAEVAHALRSFQLNVAK